MTIGGGNEKGVFTESSINAIITNLPKVPAAGYSGIVFDIEVVNCSSSTIIPLFAKAFSTAKSLNLTVVVTTSHSAPSNTTTPQDAIDIVTAWQTDSNIDMLSPQIYSTGTEASPDFSETD